VKFRVLKMGCIPYAEARALQQQIASDRLAGIVPDTLVLLQHPATITVARAADRSHLLRSPAELEALGIEVTETDRGGDVTYHGPGQLVGYPILDLRSEPHRQDLNRYLRRLEATVMRALERFGLAAGRFDGHTGVWIDLDGTKPVKICAIGIRVSRWVTQHGFALNVCPRLEHFETIVPCGIHDYGVTSMAHALGQAVTVEEVVPVIVEAFGETFDMEPEWPDNR
jgi:lipoyl(octanoyl) transferase